MPINLSLAVSELSKYATENMKRDVGIVIEDVIDLIKATE